VQDGWFWFGKGTGKGRGSGFVAFGIKRLAVPKDVYNVGPGDPAVFLGNYQSRHIGAIKVVTSLYNFGRLDLCYEGLVSQLSMRSLRDLFGISTVLNQVDKSFRQIGGLLQYIAQLMT